MAARIFDAQWFRHKAMSVKWTNSLATVPRNYDYVKLREYLIESRNKTYDKESMRAFKSLKGFKYFDSGYVQRMKTANVIDTDLSPNPLFLCKAQVMASMARQVNNVNVCLHENGDVLGGSCECVAGKGEACNHVAAVLFALEDYVAKGLNMIPDDQTATEKLKQWNRPAKRQVQPMTIDKIEVYRPEHGKKRRQSVVIDDPRAPADRFVSPDKRRQLWEEINIASPNSGFAKYGLCSTNILNESNILNENIPSFVFPPSLNQIIESCHLFKKSLMKSEDEISYIESNTRQQSHSVLWFRARSYRLTASNFHAVIKRKSNTCPKNLLVKLLNYKNGLSTKAMQFGLKMEEEAAVRYKTYKQQLFNEEISLMTPGFQIFKDHPYLGASSDRIATLAGQKNVVEIKNPLSTWDLSLSSAARKLPCLCIDDNEQVTLNKSHMYHTQIQGQMAAYNIYSCDFVLCTNSDIFVENIKFENSVWKHMQNKLEFFYDNIMLPEIVYPRVKFGLDPLILH